MFLVVVEKVDLLVRKGGFSERLKLIWTCFGNDFGNVVLRRAHSIVMLLNVQEG